MNALLLAAASVVWTPIPDPPQAGDNQIEMVVSGEDGKPVENAKIDLLLFMPAMGAMPRMEEKADVAAKGEGRYAASFDLSMGGTWELTAKIESGGKTETVHGSITTGIPGVALKGGLGKSTQAAEGPMLDLGPDRLQLIGVRFAEAKPTPMKRDVEAPGVVEQDKTHREEVTLRVSGYMVKQFRGRVGDTVKAGEPLFSVYSPDLVTAQSELFLAQSLASGGEQLLQAATEKLKNLGLSPKDVDEIKRAGKPRRDVVVRARIDGTILEINSREGASINAGEAVYVIGDLSQTFVEARVFQQDLAALKVGQEAMVSFPGGLGSVKGTVSLIYSQVEQGAGTANVRVEVKEFHENLRPGAFVDVAVPVDLGSQLAIPTEAILHSGRHQYVFIDRGAGALEPREVVLGPTAGGMTAVKEGLAEGDKVAASGTFLLGSEAQLRSALPKWAKP